jgi:CheY-like chemotaxis protein
VEATRRLRASSGPNADVPVIALTANVLEDQCQAYTAAGMDAWAPKPIDARALLQAIAAAVDPAGSLGNDQAAPLPSPAARR